MKTFVHHFDSELTQVVARLPTGWHPFFLLVTSLGDPVVTIGVGAAIAATGLYHHMMRVTIAGLSVWGTLALGSVIKLLVNRARPATEYAAHLRIDTYSFPSGHSSGSMIAYGLLAYFAWKLLPQPWGIVAAIVCGCLILLVGISRIYLGAHFPSDVVAGWLLGAVVLLGVTMMLRPLG